MGRVWDVISICVICNNAMLSLDFCVSKICILPPLKWFENSSLITINHTLLYVSIELFPFPLAFCKGQGRLVVVHIQTCPPHMLLLTLGGCSVVMNIYL
jgi:hypothetical protein